MVKNSRIGIVIQARYNSTRLPGKVLLKLPFGSQVTILQNIIDRAKAVGQYGPIILATSKNQENDKLAEIAKRNQIAVVRGDENNVLGRFEISKQLFDLSHIVRLTGDNPFVDPKIINKTIDYHISLKSDYTETVGLPIGANVEIFSANALASIPNEKINLSDIEHVTNFFKRNPNFYFNNQICLQSDNYNDIRLTIDYRQDYIFACFLYEQLYQKEKIFGTDMIVKILEKYPWAKEINMNLPQKKPVGGNGDEGN